MVCKHNNNKQTNQNVLVSGESFWVLGGQHSAWAAKEAYLARLKAEQQPAKWMKYVRADILKASVPVEDRKKYAGLQQAQQEDVRKLCIADVARHMSNRPKEGGCRANLIWAIQVSGKQHGDAVCLFIHNVTVPNPSSFSGDCCQTVASNGKACAPVRTRGGVRHREPGERQGETECNHLQAVQWADDTSRH